MTIKSILCIFSGSQDELGAVDAALLLAKKHAAHIRFLHISPNPASYAGLYGDSVIASAYIIEAIEKENEKLLQKARQYVVSATTKHHVPLDAADMPVHHASARFVHATGYLNGIIREEGRLSDLIVVGRGIAKPDAFNDSAIMAALFNTGRPVMLLPSKPSPDTHKIITLAWKGTQEAARALHNAMPFLQEAEKVYVLTAEEPGKTYDLEADAALLNYLHIHGINAQCIVVATGNRAAPEALLQRAKDLKSDLIVMGAYGHSRLRETILGGVTQYMIETSDIPLLLSH